jgi:hypothetical protein
MSNKLLITQFAVGPTHKARLLHNLKTCEAYKYFDVYVLTDTPEMYIGLGENIFTENINSVRPEWSIEHEVLPKEKYDEALYAKELMETGLKIPTCMRRFAFGLPDVERYDGFLFMDCDILPILNDESYRQLEDYFVNPMSEHPDFKGIDTTGKMIVCPASLGYNISTHGFLAEYASEINKKYSVTNRTLNNDFIMTDGNFRTIKFQDKAQIKPFYELLNSIIRDIVVDKNYFFLKGGSMWSVHSEYVLSIIFNLMAAEAFPMSPTTGINHNTFKVCCYPEDRYWNWGTNMVMSMIGKMDFVQKNCEKLKTFYANRAQHFNYEC